MLILKIQTFILKQANPAAENAEKQRMTKYRPQKFLSDTQRFSGYF